MLRVYNSITTFILLIFAAGNVCGQVVFQSTIGGIEDQNRMYSVYQTEDGGYIGTGYTEAFGPTDEPDAYVVKTDRLGNEEWKRVIGGAGNDRGREIRQTDDGGYIMVGYTGSYGMGYLAVWLVKFDDEGNVEWSKAYGGDGDDRGFDIEITDDGGYILAGYSDSYNPEEEHDILLIKTDSEGELEWSNTYGGPAESRAYGVNQTSDGGFVVSGRTASYGAGDDDNIFLVKTDSDGLLEWSNAYGEEEEDRSYSVIQTEDDGYVIAGRTLNHRNGVYDIIVIKAEENGDIEWAKVYGGIGDDIGRDVKETPEGDLVIAAYGLSGAGNQDMAYAIRLNSDGDLLWSRGYGGPERDRCFSVDLTSDKGAVFGCYSENYSGDELEYYIIKTDEEGDGGCNELNIDLTEATIGIQQEADGIQRTDDVNVESIQVDVESEPFDVFRDLCCVPKAGFDIETDEDNMELTARLSDADNYLWEINGDNAGNDETITHPYDPDEPYEVCLTVDLTDCGESTQNCENINQINNLAGEQTEEHPLTIYPNPAQGDITLELENHPGTPVEVTLISATGSEVFNKKFESARSEYAISAGNVEPGFYIMNVQYEDRVYREKVRLLP